MQFIDEQLVEFKNLIENAIKEGGVQGKNNLIRTSSLINLIHDAVKYELIEKGVNPDNIFPKLYETRPEVKIAGFLKQKNQDVCVVPNNIKKSNRKIDWGPLAYERKIDEYGEEYSTNTLVINIRSQMSSIAKNTDTLFERTFAEALNLHLLYKNIVLGEVYLIPAYEYDDEMAKEKKVGFKTNKTDISKYVSFFSAMNGRKMDGHEYAYERVALLIVDFNRKTPKLYRTTKELIDDGLIPKDFSLDYEELNFDNFAEDILSIYEERYNIENILI